MSHEIRTADHRYWAVEQGDGNFVVYDEHGEALWDRWNYEAGLAAGGEIASPPAPATPIHTNTPRRIQVTQPEDGAFHPRMYSYWANAYVTGGRAIVFAGHIDNQARFFDVDLVSGQVTRLGTLINYSSTTEGWYWDREGRITFCDGPKLRRVTPFSLTYETLIDIRETHPGCRLWQAHSSDDGNIHSATVERVTSDGPYERLGTLLGIYGRQRFIAAAGVLDESQVTRDGAYLVIKEDDDNRIITVATGEERRITDAAGAVGHSDCGESIVIGEDNILGACVLWDLSTLEKQALFATWGMGYVAVRGRVCINSDDTHLNRVDLDTGTLTPLIAHGGGSSYDGRVKANLSPCGRVACYMANGLVYLLVL